VPLAAGVQVSVIDLSVKAEALLMSVKLGSGGLSGLYVIERTLGMQTWETKGKKGKRADVAELYRHGLVEEWFNPLSPPIYLTKEGERQHSLRKGANA